MFFWFFFFQAEDGIRDDLVTGVQTCALPISGDGDSGRGRDLRRSALRRRPRRGSGAEAEVAGGAGRNRSEERRVGKSVDLGGRRSIKKKKRKNNMKWMEANGKKQKRVKYVVV